MSLGNRGSSQEAAWKLPRVDVIVGYLSEVTKYESFSGFASLRVDLECGCSLWSPENATRRLSGMTYTQDWIFILAQTILFMFSDQDRPVRLPSQAAEHGEAADLIIVQFGRGSHKRARHDDGVLPHHLLNRMIPAERKLSCGI